MKPINNPVVQKAAAALQEALKSGNDEMATKAFEEFSSSVVESIKNDYEMAHNDSTALAQRGYRMLTAEEKKFYEQWIENAKSNSPKQEFTSLLEGGMPETIIEDVYKNLVNKHPLLNAITFTNVSYLTKFIMNDHTIDKAVWGQINSEVTKKITSSFKILEMTQCKLSCYSVIPKDMLELGPVYLDNYIRTILTDALACALEDAVVNGTGKNQPIGLNRNISATASVVGGEYPKKSAVKVTSFLPKEYGPLVARMAKTEKNIYRQIGKVALICNPIDYLNKVMPATTVLNAAGTYTNNIFPVPTDVYQSAELKEGEAILCLPEEYFMGLGSSKSGTITYDDSTQFLEDNRVYMIKTFANGRAFDNTVSVLLDISELDPAYITVKNLELATV